MRTMQRCGLTQPTGLSHARGYPGEEGTVQKERSKVTKTHHWTLSRVKARQHQGHWLTWQAYEEAKEYVMGPMLAVGYENVSRHESFSRMTLQVEA